MIKKMSLQVLQDYTRFFLTEGKSTQTSYSFIDDLKEELREKTETVVKLLA